MGSQRSKLSPLIHITANRPPEHSTVPWTIHDVLKFAQPSHFTNTLCLEAFHYLFEVIRMDMTPLERIQIHTRFARLRNELQIPFALYRCKVVVGIIYDICDQSISHPEHPSPDSDDLEDFLPPDPRPTYISTDHANRSTVRPDLSRDSQVSATLADVRTAPDPAVTKTKAYHAQESRRIAQPQVSANTDSRSEDIFSGLNRISPTGPIRKVAAVHNVQDIFSSLERQTPVGPIIRRRGGT